MSSANKLQVLEYIRVKCGHTTKMGVGQSMFSIGEDAARIYFRYSKVHGDGKTFYGLRDVDLRALEGHNSFICFLNDRDAEPILVPYADFEEVFRTTTPAEDGQYKVQLLNRRGVRELYLARVGRFNIEGFIGFESLFASLSTRKLRQLPELTHSQVQTLLAEIGHLKGFEVMVPVADCSRLDWSLTRARFPIIDRVPAKFTKIEGILAEIDVVWTRQGSESIENLFEVEHSTPVYSGLLRFNDVLLTDRSLERFSIVSNDSRRALFSRQINRPTFVASGLFDKANFLEYLNVYEWHRRISSGRERESQ